MFRVLQLALAAAFLAAHAPGQTVGVFLDFDAVPSRASLDVMKKEVDTLLKPAGVLLDWHFAAENQGKESFDGLVVLKFKGKCRVESWSNESQSRQTTLGATQVSNGRVLPFSEVKCDAVKQALSYLRPESNPLERQRALGLAMGRVVAHELYHVLAGTTAHAARGLAKAIESLQDLISGPASFSSDASDAIRKALLP